MMVRQQPQSAAPTVGDTLTVVHRVSVPAGALVQPRAPTDSLIATLVGAPVVQREGDSVRIAYTLAVWTPGRHELHLPGAVVLIPGGAVDTLPDATVPLQVASVLPVRVAAESLTPRALRPWIPQTERSAWPFVALLVPVLMLLGAVAWWYRRPGPWLPPSVSPAPDQGDTVRRRLAGWLAAGEVELTIDHLTPLIDPTGAGEAWHAAVAEARFATGTRPRLVDLAAEGIAMLAPDAESES
jgi:hypothetical protein